MMGHVIVRCECELSSIQMIFLTNFLNNTPKYTVQKDSAKEVGLQVKSIIAIIAFSVFSVTPDLN